MSAGTWIFKTERLKELRTLKGLSPEGFGREINKSGFTILNWETGKGSPRGIDLAAIGTAFQIDPCSFFERVEP